MEFIVSQNLSLRLPRAKRIGRIVRFIHTLLVIVHALGDIVKLVLASDSSLALNDRRILPKTE